ncbi:hypothetical protein B0T24DRAFT_421196 [Lasiosphaeria ovina]|uniref:Uncharacterized protein n=1 Tax=Lasiosphaeria ovina TaxID=92902 RepID=A0AAE0MZ66_9PEZI|nr:hypothetical protein B0T24DRAFT_421196 [Lasiosphaeria ovina]
MLEPPSVKRFHTGDTRQGKPLKRKSRPLNISRSDLKLEWKLFVEQSLFYILSNPELLIRSFTKKGRTPARPSPYQNRKRERELEKPACVLPRLSLPILSPSERNR